MAPPFLKNLKFFLFLFWYFKTYLYILIKEGRRKSNTGWHLQYFVFGPKGHLYISIARSIRYEPKQQCRESHSLLTPTCIYDTNFFIIFNFKFITAAYSGPIRWRIGKGPWPPAKCQGIDNITILFLFIIFYVPLAAVMFREVFLYPLRCKSPIKTINYTQSDILSLNRQNSTNTWI